MLEIPKLIPCYCKCGERISVQKALEVLRGDGHRKHFMVKIKTTGQEVFIAECDINPQTMEIIDEKPLIPVTVTTEPL